MDRDELLVVLGALGHTLRLRTIVELSAGQLHVSELARRLGISRPLLYMHLERLERAGLVEGHLELSSDGKAMKYFALTSFDIHINPAMILAAERATADRPAEDAGDTEDEESTT